MTGDGQYLVIAHVVIVSIHARRVTGDKDEKDEDEKAEVSIHARRVTGDATSEGLGRLV